MMRRLTVRRELSKLDKRYCCYSVTKLHARLPCPSLSPRVCSDSYPLSWWCHPSIHCIFCHPFSPRLQYFPASWSFPTSPLFTSGGQSIWASASVLPMNIQGWFSLRLTGLISLHSKWILKSLLQLHSLKASILLHSAFYSPTHTSVYDYWKNHSFDYMDLCRQSDAFAFQYPV